MKKIVRFCVIAMLENNVIEESQSPLITYGLELLFSSVLNVLSILLIGALTGRESSMFLLLLVSIPLQSFGGGYHCKTHLMCWILTTGGYLLAAFGAEYLSVWILLCSALLCAYPFLCLSPVENIYAPFGEIFKGKMKKIVRKAYFCAILVSLILLAVENESVKLVLAAVTMEGISVLCAEKKYQKL